MTNESLTHDELISLLEYKPDTGCFVRIKAVGNNGNWKAGDNVGSVDTQSGYVKIGLKGKRFYAHRLAWFYVHGVWPKGKIDHINHVRNDNRLINLRDVDDFAHARNCSMQSNNASGATGVYWNTDRNKWQARIMVNRKNLYLGMFDNIKDAKNARKLAEVEHGFHSNHGLRA